MKYRIGDRVVLRETDEFPEMRGEVVSVRGEFYTVFLHPDDAPEDVGCATVTEEEIGGYS